MHVEHVLAVLQRVGDAARPPGQLAGLAHRHEARAHANRHGRAEHEAPGLHRGDQVHAPTLPRLAHALDRHPQRLRVAQERGDVPEQDARNREVGHVADVGV